jgi:O-antigen/teichoic acid export membrane protein
LAGIRQLASQTLWFGLSSIVGRFINYLLNPILTLIYAAEPFGEISILFAGAAFLNIVFTFGMETAYFRFSRDHEFRQVFNNTFVIILSTTTFFTILLLLNKEPLATFMGVGKHPEYVVYMVLIVALDSLTVIPFSKLRQESRPKKFAVIKLFNILVNVGLVIFFLYFCKGAAERGEKSMIASFYKAKLGIGYVFISQLVASGLTWMLLVKEWKSFRFEPDKQLIATIFRYSLPMIIVGFGGMINETIDRFLLLKRFPDALHQMEAVGIYTANYKLAALIVIFIQAFRMGAEPFFFKNADNSNAKETYARIMNFFVIACCICFLGVSLFPDIWKHFMGVRKHPEYLSGLFLVPILMLAKIFLGIYYNLSIWYKLTDKISTGAYITIGGALITIAVNYTLIPYLGYLASALATVVCYASMMLASYVLGQKHYPVPYDVKKCFGYIGLSIILFIIHHQLRETSKDILMLHSTAMALIALFTFLVLKMEKTEFSKIPYLKNIYRFI